MTVYFTSDLHIGHAKAAAHRGYEDPAEHDRILAERWDATVSPDDSVWVLGDLSAGGRAAQEAALAWVDERPGEAHLVLGNHDGPHPMYRDAHKWMPAYLEVFASVASAARRRIEGRSVLLSHFPYRRDRGATRHAQWRLPDLGEWLLHGHTHGAERLTAADREVHVGVDAWDLTPVSLDEVARLIRVDEERREANRKLRAAFLAEGVPCDAIHNHTATWPPTESYLPPTRAGFAVDLAGQVHVTQPRPRWLS